MRQENRSSLTPLLHVLKRRERLGTRVPLISEHGPILGGLRIPPALHTAGARPGNIMTLCLQASNFLF